ncbi:hypothetical protein ABIC08_008367 [Bradyrhizobium sp. RT9b]|uniref:hypothetical protein n=1 Tax=unclassified Bradyrhizobium TaxID=2631580 RepID=UPI003393DDDF
MASELAKNDVKSELTTQAQTALENLDTAFQEKACLAASISRSLAGKVRRSRQ